MFNKAVLTEIRVASPLYPAEDYHQKYVKKNLTQSKFYRYSCGRDKRVGGIWGRKQESCPQKVKWHNV